MLQRMYKVLFGSRNRKEKQLRLTGLDDDSEQKTSPTAKSLKENERPSRLRPSALKSPIAKEDDFDRGKFELFQLSNAERAFLPREVQIRLGKLAGQLIPAPSVYPSKGAALFVDISGFTVLGEQLRQQHNPREAASLLATKITHVLGMLTKICLDYYYIEDRNIQ